MGSKKISQLSSNTNPSLTGVTIFDDGSTSYKTSLQTLREKLVDSGSHHFTGSQFVSGSLNVTGSFGVYGGGAVKEFLFVSGFQVIGTPTHHMSGDPEVLHVGSLNTFNIAHLQGNHDHYAQVNVKNVNAGNDASSDIVVTANNGSEDNFYVNMGINSSTYNAGEVGYQNDSYIISSGNDLYIGSSNANVDHNNVHIYTTGNWENPAISVLDNNFVGFNTMTVEQGYKYEFNGNVKFDNEINVNGTIDTNGYDISTNGGNLNGVIANVFKLHLTDNSILPSGILGDLAASGSNIFFYNGTDWKKIILEP